MALGMNTRPMNFSQYFWWMAHFTTLSRNLQVVALVAVCWAIWKLRNRACFEHKLIRSPAEIVCYACSFLKYWAGLRPGGGGGGGDLLRQGAAMLQEEALGLHPAQAKTDVARILDN
ncbi:hypothetical protein BRADI_4g36133v3 [Brachypodium distachyon]|uniref:Uncharacterized protein n=1 Tax=Brachypodium distachyon TaxID=15368 RepID=A0A2K2CSK7_BRADI|nr:hypothetical protein BRADI_4g36133v3 [Brachypodium distachyon]